MINIVKIEKIEISITRKDAFDILIKAIVEQATQVQVTERQIADHFTIDDLADFDGISFSVERNEKIIVEK